MIRTLLREMEWLILKETFYFYYITQIIVVHDNTDDNSTNISQNNSDWDMVVSTEEGRLLNGTASNSYVTNFHLVFTVNDSM